MRVLMLCCEFPPLGGGAGKAVHGLAASLVRAGHEAHVLTAGFAGLPRRELVDGIRVERVPSLRARKDRSNVLELGTYIAAVLAPATRLARRRRYDVCHAHFILPDGLIAWLLRRATGQRYVLTAHGSDVPGYNPDRFGVLHRGLAPLWRRIVADAERLVCPSPTLERLVQRQPGVKRTAVVPYGFDADRFHPNGPKEAAILAVSRLFERKGIQHALEAASRLDPAPEVHVVGEGPYRPALERLAAARGLRARFHGWIDNDAPELAALYGRLGIFVLPSASENFPVSLLEAMSAGMAIVTTRDTGCADVVGDAGLLVRHGDIDGLRAALACLVAEQRLRDEYGLRARRRVEDLAWPRVAARYVELYREGLAWPGAA